MVSEIAEETRLVAPAFTIETNIAPGITARCDEYAIRRVIRILLSNAIKYAADNRHGNIQITADSANITIRDNGIGIPQEHLPHIFERFYRADPSRSRKTGSSGLGLSIAKEIIHAHGGEISAESSPLGTQVAFNLTPTQARPNSNTCPAPRRL
jgi:two-component system OmpR family sensor kinase